MKEDPVKIAEAARTGEPGMTRETSAIREEVWIGTWKLEILIRA